MPLQQPNIKDGDRVIYIKKERWAEEDGLIIGMEYTASTDSRGSAFRIKEGINRFLLFRDSFVLADPPIIPVNIDIEFKTHTHGK